MSWMGSMPKLTTTLKIPMTNYDSGPASVVRLSLILSKCARAMSSFDDRSCPSVGCGCVPTPLPELPLAPPGPSPVGKEGFCVPPMFRRGCCLDLEPEAHSWAENSNSAASAQARLASRSLHASPSACTKAASPPSHVMTTPSRLSSCYS
jgi:hypothetical protein